MSGLMRVWMVITMSGLVMTSMTVIADEPGASTPPAKLAGLQPPELEGFWQLKTEIMRNDVTLYIRRAGQHFEATYHDQYGDAKIDDMSFDDKTLHISLEREIDHRPVSVEIIGRLLDKTLTGFFKVQVEGGKVRKRPFVGRQVDEQQLKQSRRRLGVSYGPFVGHLTSGTANLWYRAAQAGKYELQVSEEEGDWRSASHAQAEADHDFCVTWTLSDLLSDVVYSYRILFSEKVVAGGDALSFRTLPATDAPQLVRLAFASCAAESGGTLRAWQQMEKQNPHAVVLLGDTPYIDTTELDIQRMRYGQFAAVPEFAGLLTSRPLYGTWDDHDFGRNDTDGRLIGKQNSRKAFIEYHAMQSYGDGEQGIYTSFRRGGVEVFLLDARTFAGTESSPFAPDKLTLLGKQQWQWLKTSLRESTAPFKLLATGMIWNKATRPNKTDHWMHYPHERAALFEFLGQEAITGVVLIGGDIHRTRALLHQTTDVVGYDLHEWITSPMHDSIIEAANAPHPDLKFDAGEPHTFLIVECSTTDADPVLHARFLNADGRLLYEAKQTLQPPTSAP